MNPELPLKNETEMLIMMHRDAHFRGSFPEMLDYYLRGGKGISNDFDQVDIEKLFTLEKESKINLAEHILSDAEAIIIENALEAYQQLRSVYLEDPKVSKIPRLIADLILTEDPNAEKEISALVAEKSNGVPPLIKLLRTPHYYDPLFPGYGLAPIFAAKCLGEIGDKRAIISLFEGIGDGDFFDEDVLLHALYLIGEPAKTFLLTVLRAKPYNVDNEKAAIGLFVFKEDPEVAKACLSLLNESEVQNNLLFATYLILCCAGLQNEEDRQALIAIGNKEKFDRALKEDIRTITKEWAKY